MLTPQQIESARKQIGLTAPAQNNATAEVARRQQLAAEYDANTAKQKESEASSFSGRVKEDLTKRGQDIVQSYGREQAGTQSRAGTMLDAAGGSLAMLGDVGKEAYNTLPQFLRDAISKAKEMSSQAMEQSIDPALAGANSASRAATGHTVQELALQKASEAWNKFKESDPQSAQHLESLATIAKTGVAAYAGGQVAEAGTTAATNAIKNAGTTAAKVATDVAESPTVKGGVQTAKEFTERIPRAIERVKEGAQIAAERAAKIATAEPKVANAMKVKLDDGIINTVTEADPATRAAYRKVLDIAEETANPQKKKIGMKKQPSIVSGDTAVEQYDMISEQKKSIGQQLGAEVEKLPANQKSVDIRDSISQIDQTLSNQGVRAVIDEEKGSHLDFSGSDFTTAERTKINELYQLATEAGDKLAPKQIQAKDRLFSKLQREARMEGIGDIVVDTTEGPKSLFGVFRDVFSSKLEDLNPKIRELKKQYRDYSNLTDDIENSIFKTPDFNATKHADPAEFAKVNLRRIFGEAQSSPVFDEIASQMDTQARKLGYEGAAPKTIAEFAQEMRKLYPDSIPKTGFTGGIKTGIFDLAKEALNAGAPNLMDQRKALIELLDNLINPNKPNLKK